MLVCWKSWHHRDWFMFIIRLHLVALNLLYFGEFVSCVVSVVLCVCLSNRVHHQ